MVALTLFSFKQVTIICLGYFHRLFPSYEFQPSKPSADHYPGSSWDNKLYSCFGTVITATSPMNHMKFDIMQPRSNTLENKLQMYCQKKEKTLYSATKITRRHACWISWVCRCMWKSFYFLMERTFNLQVYYRNGVTTEMPFFQP